MTFSSYSKKINVLGLITITAAIALGGCKTSDGSTSKTTWGSVVGAVVGAAAGQAAGHDKKSTAIGAVIGGLAGAGVGKYMDNQQEELEKKLASERAAHQVEIEKLKDQTLKVKLDSSATFAVNSATLNPTFEQSIAKIAKTVSENNQTAVHIYGYTDSTGSDSYNKTLSTKRAASVDKFFESQGVAADRIRTYGGGESNPIGDNTTEAGRAMNRRVEIYLKPIIEGQESNAYTPPV